MQKNIYGHPANLKLLIPVEGDKVKTILIDVDAIKATSKEIYMDTQFHEHFNNQWSLADKTTIAYEDIKSVRYNHSTNEVLIKYRWNKLPAVLEFKIGNDKNFNDIADYLKKNHFFETADKLRTTWQRVRGYAFGIILTLISTILFFRKAQDIQQNKVSFETLNSKEKLFHLAFKHLQPIGVALLGAVIGAYLLYKLILKNRYQETVTVLTPKSTAFV